MAAPLRLHDVEDAATFCAIIAQRSGLELSYHEREDLQAWLLGEAWRLSLRYEPGVIRRGFAIWAATTLRRRVVDWQRQRKGRSKWQFAGFTYERPRPRFVSLDDTDVVDTLPAGTGDPAADSSPDLAGVLRDGDRTRARDYAALGLGPPRRTA